MFELVVSDDFLNDLNGLTAILKSQTLKALRLLAENPAHPSLRAHRLDRIPVKNKWEAYVTDGDRLVFETVGKEIRLWRVGPHSVVDRIQYYPFSPHTVFRRLEEEPQPVVEEKPFEIPSEWLQPKANREPDNHFAHFPAAHLRILGVPAQLVKAVRGVPYLEDLERIPGLPAHTLKWLLELATDEKFEDALFNPSRLIFRTTLDRLEGYCEGRIKRLMLNLTEDQQQFVEKEVSGALLLRGCAGSGKTTVAIYRAMHSAARNERVLFLTYNKTLSHVAQTLMQELIGSLPENLRITHLDSWQVGFLRERGFDIQIASSEEQRQTMQEAVAATTKRLGSPSASLPWTWFRDEIARVIKGNGLQTEDEYINRPRYGRKTPMRGQARHFVWEVYQAYQQGLKNRKRQDWQDIAILTYNELLGNPLKQPFDHIVIDEAQDMTAMQLRVAQRLNKGGTPSPNRSVFLVGDTSQTLYSRGFAWKDAGLQLQGRSFALRKNFRNTRQIAESAAALLSNNRIIKMSEDYVDPNLPDRIGPRPIVLECDQTGREQQSVCEKILALAEGQLFRLSDFAVLTPTLNLIEEYRRALQGVQIPCVAHNENEFDILEDRVKLLTIHSAKGLEFPVIFVVGLHNGVLPRSLQTVDEEERAIEMERERTLCYVAMTRAAEALYMVTSQQNGSSFVAEIRHTAYVEPFPGGKA